MKHVKTLGLGAALVLSLLGTPPAWAANWDPQGTTFVATQVGLATWTDDTGAFLATCANGSASLSASGAVAMTTSATNPIQFTNCTAGGTPISVTTLGTWSFTATSTTTVDLTADNGANGVGTMIAPFSGCHLDWEGPLQIANNIWSNAAHTLTFNSTANTPWHATNLVCTWLHRTTARPKVTFSFPTATIT